jgi:DNA-binding MarR family transcriptional regulator
MDALPLSALLSQALVAFTVEFDNEFERQMPHRTTKHGAGSGPWLVSMVMWLNCMRFVGGGGVTVGELEDRARTKTNLNGMERWGYVVVEQNTARRADRLIRATAKGRLAQQVWRPLFDTIEKRWQERFGADEIERIRDSLRELAGRIEVALPDCLPILGYGLYSRGPDRQRRAPVGDVGSGTSLAALLSRVLLAFAIEFERESALSLAISANVVRVLDEKGVRVRDLPMLSGVSKEAIAMAMGILQKGNFVIVEPVKVVRLTPKGREAQDAYHQLTRMIEKRWQARFGEGTIRSFRESLERLAGEPLFRGLDPYPDGWRASVPVPKTLPHYPMVLHRGGFPDGS